MRRSKRLLALRAVAATLVMLASAVALVAPAQATFPGRNGRIAFDDFTTGQIYTINPDGSDLTQLTHVAAPDVVAFSPSWSPDGTKIVFASNASGPSRIWIMDADGSDAHKLRGDSPGYDDFQPRYTPSGKRILFARCGPDLPTGFVGCALYTVRTDGSGRGAITQFKREVVDFSPSISPNGKRIAFTRFNAHGIQAQVYLMRSDGSGAHAVTPPELQAFGPDWAPAGHGFTFASNCCRLFSRIYRWRSDESQITRLTSPNFPHSDFNPSYSPNGNRIVFQSDRGNDLNTFDLFVMRADGAHLARITTTFPGADSPSWGPAASSATAAPETAPVAPERTVSPRDAAAALAARCALQARFAMLAPCVGRG